MKNLKHISTVFALTVFAVGLLGIAQPAAAQDRTALESPEKETYTILPTAFLLKESVEYKIKEATIIKTADLLDTTKFYLTFKVAEGERIYSFKQGIEFTVFPNETAIGVDANNNMLIVRFSGYGIISNDGKVIFKTLTKEIDDVIDLMAIASGLAMPGGEVMGSEPTPW